MNYDILIVLESAVLIFFIIFFILYRNRIQKKVCKINTMDLFLRKKTKELETIKTEIAQLTKQLHKNKLTISKLAQEIESFEEKAKHANNLYEDSKMQYVEYSQQLEESRRRLNDVNVETSALQELSRNGNALKMEVDILSEKSIKLSGEIKKIERNKLRLEKERYELMSSIDLYSRLNEFVYLGHFKNPEYLNGTSAEVAKKIEIVRDKQKQLIKNKLAIECPDSLSITSDKKTDQSIIRGQIRLMLSSFNIKCDTLIGKVKNYSFSRTLEHIEKLATMIEKDSISLHCGFRQEYVRLKYEECKLYYQYTLKNKEEESKSVKIVLA